MEQINNSVFNKFHQILFLADSMINAIFFNLVFSIGLWPKPTLKKRKKEMQFFSCSAIIPCCRVLFHHLIVCWCCSFTVDVSGIKKSHEQLWHLTILMIVFTAFYFSTQSWRKAESCVILRQHLFSSMFFNRWLYKCILWAKHSDSWISHSHMIDPHIFGSERRHKIKN